MGIRCGVDIVEISRVKKSLENSGDAFRNKVFTENEIKYCENKNVVKFSSYAVRFAAKEAVSKALGTGISKGIVLKDIEVLNDENGCPYVILANKAKEIFNDMGCKDLSVSLSHCDEYAVAYVVIEI